MDQEHAKIGVRIRTNRAFLRIPAETEGVIDEDYGSGLMVAWDLPCWSCEGRGILFIPAGMIISSIPCRFCNGSGRTLPEHYREWDRRPVAKTGILRDGFDKTSELQYLDLVA